jgi:hypothetical protein
MQPGLAHDADALSGDDARSPVSTKSSTPPATPDSDADAPVVSAAGVKRRRLD